ncbi:hypothetical protein MKW98_012033 [Papaver atlanticum]|uniref:BPL/LPL catalytic domain-containing protein n=1 Tax=Papaver atlanticum TaxID=357466 RepID=A0AAD4XGK9_9MAGN|nr:hypothetical protein MKW98_012033 [Papaver atlanticum]
MKSAIKNLTIYSLFSSKPPPYHFPPLSKPSTFLTFSSGMEKSPPPSSSLSPSILVLGGKSSQENEFAKSLKDNFKNLTLPIEDSGVSVFLYDSDAEKKTYEVEEETFKIGTYMNSLSANRFGQFLIWSPRLSSTQDLIAKNFCELPIGAVCVADIQFKGRGRSRNVWESPAGCLLFSFTLQMDDGRILPLLQYVVSLAVVEALKDVCDAKGFPYLDLKIKWPNDLYLNGLKVGGVLCTSTYSSKKFSVSAGIGLNVNNEKPTTCLNAELRKLTSDACQLERENVLAAFFKRFESFFDTFSNQGFQALEELYYKAWLHSGQRVLIQEEKEGQLLEHAVTIQGLTPSGYLLAIGDDHQFYELHPDGNSLDFFKGLVRRKVQ